MPDSDGIMDNDIDASGSTITENFPKKGTYEIVCTIVNEAGASTKVTYLVSVRSSSDDGSGISPMMLESLFCTANHHHRHNWYDYLAPNVECKT